MADEPVVNIHSKFDATELETSSHSRKSTDDNGIETSIKTEVPILTSSSDDETFLYFLAQFRHARQTLEWDDGELLANKFRSSLQGSYRTEWDDTVTAEAAADAAAHDEAWFDGLVDDLVSDIFEDEDWITMRDYLREVRKPATMSPKTFLARVRHLENITAELPDSPDTIFTDDERKRNYLRAHPASYKQKFDDANMAIAGQTMLSMRKYFQRIWKREQRSATRQPQRRPQNANVARAQQRPAMPASVAVSGRGGAPRQGGRGFNRNQNQYRAPPRGPRFNDPCPLEGHGNHIWGRCRQNAANPKAQRIHAGGRNNQGQRRQGARDAHAVDHPDMPPPAPRRVARRRAQAVNNRFQDMNLGDQHYTLGGGRRRNPRRGRQRYDSDDDVPHKEQLLAQYEDAFLTIEEEGDSYEDEYESELYDTALVSEGQVRLLHSFQVKPADGPEDLSPQVVATAQSLAGKDGKYIFKALLDTGGSGSMINRRCLPDNPVLESVGTKQFVTTAGTFKSSAEVTAKGLCLPEFSFTRKFGSNTFHVFDSPMCKHDLILGRDVLKEGKMKLDFDKMTTTWCEDEVAFHPAGYFNDKQRLRDLLEPAPVAIENAEQFASQALITDAVYEHCDVDALANAQKQLTSEQRAELGALFHERELLFSGRIGKYPHRQFHIDLLDGEEAPYHCGRPYSIAQLDIPFYKREMDRQVEQGLCVKIFESEWAFPGFTRRKSNGQIRTVDDLRELNKKIRRTFAHIPTIQEMLERRRSFEFLTLIDISMQYYTFELDYESSLMCVILTPFGMYRRTRLPMGLKPSAGWAQATMNEIFDDMMLAMEVYFDDILTSSNDWHDHLQSVGEILYRLEINGFTVNPLKCFWGVQSATWMGYILTTKGYTPSPTKVEAILKLAEPATPTQLCGFLGFVNFNKQFYKRRAHIFAPLSAITGKTKKTFAQFWGPAQKAAFAEAKQLIAMDVLLAYPDLSQPFDVEVDASDYQLGGVIKQNGQMLACFSRKLTTAQRKYTTIEKELLSAFETLTRYKSLLQGGVIRLHTDHKNLTYKHLTSDRCLHWRNLLEAFDVTFVYKPGEVNINGDFLSRHPQLTEAAPLIQSQFFHAFNDTPSIAESWLLESLINVPAGNGVFPLNLPDIATAQTNDAQIQHLLLSDPAKFELQDYGGSNLVCRRSRNGQWKIALPSDLVDAAIEWYHAITAHGGETRTRLSLETFFWYPNLRIAIAEHVRACDSCQRFKQPGPVEGQAPPRDDTAVPWSDVAVDLIGPWRIEINGRTLEFYALQAIDIATTLFELSRIDERSSANIWTKFENSWLARYPRPVRVIHDQGGEFIGAQFQSGLATLGIQGASITSKNPQANAICERSHRVIKDMIRTICHGNPPDDVGDALDVVETVLASTTHASRTAVHRTLGISPGSLAFHRDMILPIPVLADYDLIQQRRQTIIDENARKENSHRNFRDYQPGDEILVRVHNPAGLDPRAVGPFVIAQVHTNGTVAIERTPNVYERINIRRIRSYHRE